MPNYEFVCPNCGATAEELRSVARRNAAKKCMACGHSHMDREQVGKPFVRSDTNFQMQAITSTGEKISGNFTGAKKRSWTSANARKRTHTGDR